MSYRMSCWPYAISAISWAGLWIMPGSWNNCGEGAVPLNGTIVGRRRRVSTRTSTLLYDVIKEMFVFPKRRFWKTKHFFYDVIVCVPLPWDVVFLHVGFLHKLWRHKRNVCVSKKAILENKTFLLWRHSLCASALRRRVSTRRVSTQTMTS